MLRRTLVKSLAVAGSSLAVPVAGFAQSNPGSATPASGAGATPTTAPQSGYAPVNGLEVYYEIHGSGEPLVLLHGGLMTIDLQFGPYIPALSANRQVIAIAAQGHGRTADIDRPITYENLVKDAAAALQYLEIENADIFGNSMGGVTALGLAIHHPELVRKMVVASAPFNNEGMRPENIEGQRNMTPDALAGTPMAAAYLEVAPNPEDWPVLLEKMGQLSVDFQGWAPADIEAIDAPTLITVGDADAIYLDHAVELLRLLGGDVNGDFVGVPASQLAVIPGTTHFTGLARTDVLLPLISTFLDAPMPEEG